MSDEQEVSEETNVPMGIRALSYAMDEMSFIHQQLAIVTWLCDQMYAVLRAMDEEPTDDTIGPWFAQVKETMAMYENLFPCCEDCEEKNDG